MVAAPRSLSTMSVFENTRTFPESCPVKVHIEEGLQVLPDNIFSVYVSPLLVIVHVPEAGPPGGHTPVTTDADAV